MSLKQIFVVLAILALCIGGVLLVNSNKSSTVKAPPSALGSEPFKALPVNDVTKFSITGAGDEVVVEKLEGQWTVTSRGGYAADFSKVSKLILGVVEVKVAEEVPAGASALARLELNDPGVDGVADGAGTVVKLSGEGGKDLAVFTLGKEYEGGMTSGPFGSFANSTGRFMKKGESVVIVSGTLPEAKADAADWLNKDFFKVQKVSRLEFNAETKEDSWVLQRGEATGDYALLMPAEDELLDKAKSGPLKNAFSSPSFKDVVADASDEVTGLSSGRSFKIETFEGFRYDVKLGKTTEEGDYYLTVSVEADFPTEYTAEEPVVGEATEAEGDADAEAAKQAEEAKQEEEAFNKEVERKQEKLEKERALAGTVFVVNKWSVESLLKKRSEILEVEEEAAEEGGEVPGGEVPLIPSLQPATGASGGGGRPRVTAVTPPIEVPIPVKPADAGVEEVEAAAGGGGLKGAVESGEEDGAEEDAEEGDDTAGE